MHILNEIYKSYGNEMLLSVWGISRPILYCEYCLISDIFDQKSIWHETVQIQMIVRTHISDLLKLKTLILWLTVPHQNITTT